MVFYMIDIDEISRKLQEQKDKIESLGDSL